MLSPAPFNFPSPHFLVRCLPLSSRFSFNFVIDMVDVSHQGNVEPTKPFPANVQAEFRTTDVGEELRTPLPKFQLFLTLLIQFAEPITALVIYPFVNQFVRDIGITKGDVSKTGYYAGIIVIVPLLFLVVIA